jgi:hypothetical protein
MFSADVYEMILAVEPGISTKMGLLDVLSRIRAERAQSESSG